MGALEAMQNTLRKLKSKVYNLPKAFLRVITQCITLMIKEERRKERLVYTRFIIQDVRFALSVAIRVLGRGLIHQYYDGRRLIKYS